MNHESTIEENQERAVLYALGALCQHEARAFEEQLRDGDPQLLSDLESFEKVVEAIGYGAPPAEPPAYLFDVLRTRLQKEEQLPPPGKVFPFAERPTAFPTASTPVPSSATTSPPVRIETRRRSPATTFVPWAIAASFLVLSAVGFLAWRQAREDRDALQTQVAVTQQQVDQLRRRADDDNRKVLELARINEVLAAPDHRVIEMSRQDGVADASGKIYWDTKANQWAVAANLPPAPAGRVYQLWFVTADQKISAGLIRTDDQGHAFTVVRVPPDVTNIAAAAITLEPEGGSAQPTMPIYTLGKIG